MRSFNATLECELLVENRFRTQREAEEAVFDFIEAWYNPHRRHPRSAISRRSTTSGKHKRRPEIQTQTYPRNPPNITEKQIDDTFNTNVKGVVFTVQNALPLLREGSSIILNASTTSIKGTAAFSVYSASKAAVRNLARSWIVDLKGRNIRVNVISPGVVPTPGYDGLGLSKEQIQGFVDAQVGTIPAGRVGTTDEIAKAVSFLASDDSSFVNGVELFVDGGMTQI